MRQEGKRLDPSFSHSHSHSSPPPIHPPTASLSACRWGLGAWLLLTLAAALVFGMIFYYLNPRELPYWVLEWLQRQMSEEQRGSFLQQECSSGSSVVHKTVCSWVREAVALLPDKHYIDAWHDEL